jgi:Trypsin-like peptidase domain
MLTLRFATILLAFCCLTPASFAQDISRVSTGPADSRPGPSLKNFSRAVVPITSVKLRGPLVEAEFGTGFCLDPHCQFIGTNYHVAALMKRLRIQGAKVVKRYLATGPHDQGATLNAIASGGTLRYTLDHDLAIFQLSKPLRDHHGLKFTTDDPHIGERVDVYAYPKGSISPFRGLQEFRGTFQGETANGLMEIEYSPNGDKRLRPGASGGIVVDADSGKVVGIFSGLPEGKEPIAFAVPVESLAEFLRKTQPFLAQLLFPMRTETSTEEEDFYPKYEPERSDVLQHRSGRSRESDGVELLRKRAQTLADGMSDFIAVQTYVWGSGADHVEAADAYEIEVRNGYQQYREYPDGKKWRWAPEIPGGPVAGITPVDDWSTLPLYIGTKVEVKIREAPPANIDDHSIRVFQYAGSSEDEPCRTENVDDFLLFSIHKTVDSAPYGEVWTDEHENILRMSLHCQDHGSGWGNSETIVAYGWLTKPGVERRLVPVSIVYKASRKKKLYWCRGQFVHYREFASRARMLSEASIPH